ncbi:MAG: hypothetical protein Q9209_004789 [Squamulea sp. 1 TL-2023]
MPSAHSASKRLAAVTYAQYKENLPDDYKNSNASSTVRPAATTAMPLAMGALEGTQASAQRRPRHHQRTYLRATNEFAFPTRKNPAPCTRSSAVKTPPLVGSPDPRPLHRPPQEHESPLSFGRDEVPVWNLRPRHFNARGAVKWTKPIRPAVPPAPLAPHDCSRPSEVTKSIHEVSSSYTPPARSIAAPISSTTPRTMEASSDKSYVRHSPVPNTSKMIKNQGKGDDVHLSKLRCNASLPRSDANVRSRKPAAVTPKIGSPEYLAYINRCEKDLAEQREQERGAGQATSGKKQPQTEKVHEKSTTHHPHIPGSFTSVENWFNHTSTAAAPTNSITPETAGLPIPDLSISPSFSTDPFGSNPDDLGSDLNCNTKVDPTTNIYLPGWDTFEAGSRCEPVSLAAHHELQVRLARVEKEIEKLKGEKEVWEEEKLRDEKMMVEMRKMMAENESTEEKQLMQEKKVMDEKSKLIEAKESSEEIKSVDEKKRRDTTDTKGKPDEKKAAEDDWVMLEDDEEMFVVVNSK